MISVIFVESFVEELKSSLSCEFSYLRLAEEKKMAAFELGCVIQETLT
jgi:hypothetical protein